MSLGNQLTVAYKPFHNQLRKEAFADFMKQLTQFAMAQFVEGISTLLPPKLSSFDDVLLQDGSSFSLHSGLADIFPSRFKKDQAAIECHLSISLLSQSPKTRAVTADKALNPIIVEARNGQGRKLTQLEGQKLQAVNLKTNRSEVLDLHCRRGHYEFRVIRRWFSEEKRFCLWLTKLQKMSDLATL